MLPRKADVIVIGGGVIGVSTAYYAASQGASVLVLEKGTVCSGSSYGNAGMLVPSHCNPLPTPGVVAQGLRYLFDPEGPLYIRFRPDVELARWLWRFYRSCNEKHLYHSIGIYRTLGSEGIKLHQELAEMGGDEYEYSQSGILNLYTSEKAFEEAKEDAMRVAGCGGDSEILDGDEVRNLEPAIGPRVIGGVLGRIDGRIDPFRFVTWLAGQAEQRGAHFATETEVLWLQTERRRVTKVLTTRGDFEADQVVLASGAWMPQLASQLGVRIPVEGGKGYSMTFSDAEGAPKLPLLLEEARIAVTPFAQSLRLAGTLELAGLSFHIDRRRLNAIEAQTYHYLPRLGGLKLREIWRGLRPCTPDGLPVLGRLQPWSNVHVAGGHAMKGISLGPVTGKYLSRILAGESIGMLERSLRPNRF